MKRVLPLVTVLILSNSGYSQKHPSKIEIRLYQRLDWYPEFSYNIGGRPSTDYLTIRGLSFGIISNYKHSVSKGSNLIGGIGFYAHSFNKLTNINSSFGKGNARVIVYPSPLDPIYTTDKYFYHTILWNIGAEKNIDLKNNMTVSTGIELHNYYTISQKYHLASRNIDFEKGDNRYFGLSLLLTSSLLKKFKNFEIGPLLIIPVFDTWKKDEVFPGENKSESRSKWFRGFGWGISSNYSFTTKKS